MENVITITGLKKKKDKNGVGYLTGHLGFLNVFAFPVKEKKSENSPDYLLKLAYSNGQEGELQNVTLTGLTKKTDKNGGTFLSGRLGFLSVFIFPVKEKKSEDSPDYLLKVAQSDSNGQGQDKPKPQTPDSL